jgi:CBS domain-containing protein
MPETVGDILTKKVVVVTPDSSVYDAAKRMSDLEVSSTIIVDDSVKPIGVITEKDLVKRVIVQSVDPKTMKVTDIMTSPVKTIPPDTSVFYASQMMHKNNFRRIPVVDAAGKLLGLITEGDIANYFTEKRKQFVLENLD